MACQTFIAIPLGPQPGGDVDVLCINPCGLWGQEEQKINYGTGSGGPGYGLWGDQVENRGQVESYQAQAANSSASCYDTLHIFNQSEQKLLEEVFHITESINEKYHWGVPMEEKSKSPLWF
jgi:hypothetical protein